MTRSSRLLWLAGFLLTACPVPSAPDASTDAGEVLTGELAVEWTDANRFRFVDRHGHFDFGFADSGSIAIHVKNIGQGPLALESVEQLSGEHAFRIELPTGLQLAAGGTASLNAFFEPPLTDAGNPLRAFRAQFRLSASGTAADGATALLDFLGTTGEPSLTWTPATLDFGYSGPGVTTPGEITFSNLSLAPIRLSQLSAREATSAVFTVMETSLTVPAATLDSSAPNGIVPGTATVHLAFKPVLLGPRAGQLTANTTVAQQPSIAIDLRGYGGGGDIDVRPTLAFGRVPFFASATPASFAQRSLTVQNCGFRPFPADPRGNLKLGRPDGAGGFVRPYWEVRALAGSSLSEICVGTFDSLTNTCTNDLPPESYDRAVGMVAAGPPLSIPVRITPNGLGFRTFEVSLFSNDSDEPVTRITVSANAVMLPPCDVGISPVQPLSFGVIAPSTSKELGFTIRNRSAGPNDVCVLSGLELGPETGRPLGMPTLFSLVDSPFEELELQPGQTKQIIVRASPLGPVPTTPAQVHGKLFFNLADPTRPQVELPLSATITTPCLSIFPASVDFGTVAEACSSPDRTFQIYDTCSTDVVIDSASMAAGEFSVVNGLLPGTRVSAGSAAPVTFSLRYRPLDVGTDLGRFTLSVTEDGLMQEYQVTLRGEGDPTGTNTERFTRNEKADVLFVIDDSSSMGPRQAELDQGIPSFLQWAISRGVDFRIGVTSTELSEGTLNSTDGGTRIVRNGTPDLQATAQELLHVGTSGSVESCMEPATRALTAPNISDPAKNGGFLRDEASLDVICVTDARDQAPRTPAVYLNQLLNLKQGAGRFTYNVIGPFFPVAPSGCVYDDPNDGAHDFMVDQTGGVKEEICSSDWQGIFSRLGKHVFDDPVSFPLRQRPDLAFPLVVSIDGTSIPPVDPNLMTPIWQHDLVSNAIIIAPLYRPEPGRTLTVTYRVLCLP